MKKKLQLKISSKNNESLSIPGLTTQAIKTALILSGSKSMLLMVFLRWGSSTKKPKNLRNAIKVPLQVSQLLILKSQLKSIATSTNSMVQIKKTGQRNIQMTKNQFLQLNLVTSPNSTLRNSLKLRPSSKLPRNQKISKVIGLHINLETKMNLLMSLKVLVGVLPIQMLHIIILNTAIMDIPEMKKQMKNLTLKPSSLSLN